MPTEAFENGVRWPAPLNTIRQQSKGADSALNGGDADRAYLQSDLFKTTSINSGSQAAAMQETPKPALLASSHQRGSSLEPGDHSSPFQHEVGLVRIEPAEAADNAEKPVAPVSNEALKKLSCSTKEETIASLTAKVPPSAPLLPKLLACSLQRLHFHLQPTIDAAPLHIAEKFRRCCLPGGKIGGPAEQAAAGHADSHSHFWSFSTVPACHAALDLARPAPQKCLRAGDLLHHSPPGFACL